MLKTDTTSQELDILGSGADVCGFQLLLVTNIECGA